MKTFYDVQQLMRKFGIFIYLGDRLADLELMEMELSELYHSKLIQGSDYQNALLIIRREKRLLKN